MRLIVAGCEYVGKTTLLNALVEWGPTQGLRFHLDDHFSLPDEQHLGPEDQAAILALTPTLKERYQRFQIFYHVHLLHKYDHILLAGFHLEEAVYGPRYYYPQSVNYLREAEADMPPDTILALLVARPEVLVRRMEAAPHPYPLVQPADVPAVLARFEEEFGQSTIRHKFRFDTSDLPPEQLLSEFLPSVRGYLNTEDLLRLLAARMLP